MIKNEDANENNMTVGFLLLSVWRRGVLYCETDHLRGSFQGEAQIMSKKSVSQFSTHMQSATNTTKSNSP